MREIEDFTTNEFVIYCEELGDIIKEENPI